MYKDMITITDSLAHQQKAVAQILETQSQILSHCCKLYINGDITQEELYQVLSDIRNNLYDILFKVWLILKNIDLMNK